MRNPILFTIVFAGLLFSLCAQTPEAASPEKQNIAPLPPPATEPATQKGLSGKVTISADRMEMVLSKTARLDGNVEVVYLPDGETLSSMRKQFSGNDIRVILDADHMVVFFPETAEGESASNHPEKIQANGRVRIHTPDGKSATDDQAVWDMKNGSTIILEGKCTVVSDGRVMHSTRIVYDIQANRFEAARAVITLPVESKGTSKSPASGLEGLSRQLEGK